jgi:hypothetical protein
MPAGTSAGFHGFRRGVVVRPELGVGVDGNFDFGVAG